LIVFFNLMGKRTLRVVVQYRVPGVALGPSRVEDYRR